ncbi:MAG: hypothetical protein ABFD85_05465 [Phycisphaerae bacterium]
MDRWKLFHSRKDAGDLMFYVWGERGCSLEGYLCQKFKEGPVERVLDGRNIPKIIEEYVSQHRAAIAAGYRFDDDAVPTALVYWGIGAINAAMTGGWPMHDGFTSWYEPNRSWEQIAQLKFDADNPWVQFALKVNRELWRLWEGDFHVLPFLYRSPLDAANGVRGNELFVEMYTDPQRVHALIDWCVDWMVSMEEFLAVQAPPAAPAGWGTAVWGAWLPDRGVFVNGDPVGLISREMALEFERPYNERFFARTGGALYHNHTIGLYQADLVSGTRGVLVQHFVDDPGQPSVVKALLDMPPLREKLLEASLQAPIGFWGAPADRLDELLDIVRHGRFVIGLNPPSDDPRDVEATLTKARAAGNIR